MLEKRSKLKAFVEVSESSYIPIEVYESLKNIKAHSITNERSTLYISIVEYIDVYCICINKTQLKVIELDTSSGTTREIYNFQLSSKTLFPLPSPRLKPAGDDLGSRQKCIFKRGIPTA